MRMSITGCPKTSTRHFSTGYPLLMWGSRIEKETNLYYNALRVQNSLFHTQAGTWFQGG